MVVVSGWGDPSRTYYGTDTRLFALTAGALAGAACGPVLARLGTPGDEGRARRASRTALVALALLVPFAVWGSAEDPWFARGGFQAVAALSVVAVVGLAAGGGTAVGVLGSPVAAWVGRRSYGIYLWSWPVQVLVEEGTALRGWRVDATVVVATLVLAAVSYALVERPLLRPRPAGVLGIDAGHTRSRVPVLALGTVATVAVVLVSTAGATEPPAPTRISDEEAVAAALAPEPAAATSGAEGVASRGRGAPAGPTDGRTTPFDPDAPLLVGEGEPAWTAPAPEARAGAGRPRLRAMVAGDSTAWTLGYDLTDEVHAVVGISNRAMIGCGILPPDARPIVGGVPGTYPERCAEQLEAEAIGLGGDPDVALLWIGAWEVYDQEHAGVRYQVGTPAYARFLEELLAERVARYRSHGVPTVLTLVPCFGDQHPRLGPERTDRARAEWVDERIRAVAEANRGWVRLVDPSEALCTPDGRHRTHAEDGTPLRYDGAHFDRTSASWLWDNWLVDRLGDAFEGAS
jgi:hypothetical protein